MELNKFQVENFPEHSWDLAKFAAPKVSMKPSQRILKVVIESIFPNTGLEISLISGVYEEFKHMDMFYPSGRNITLDVFVPEYNLALEYQGRRTFSKNSIGQQHYYDIYAMVEKTVYQHRDEEKREACLQQNITLIEVV